MRSWPWCCCNGGGRCCFISEVPLFQFATLLVPFCPCPLSEDFLYEWRNVATCTRNAREICVDSLWVSITMNRFASQPALSDGLFFQKQDRPLLWHLATSGHFLSTPAPVEHNSPLSVEKNYTHRFSMGCCRIAGLRGTKDEANCSHRLGGRLSFLAIRQKRVESRLQAWNRRVNLAFDAVHQIISTYQWFVLTKIKLNSFYESFVHCDGNL